MRRIGTVFVITGLLSLGIWSCGGNGDGNGPTGPEAPEVSEADYAVWGMMITAGERSAVAAGKKSAELGTIVTVAVKKNDGSESVSDWPYQKASEVKLIGPKEITLTEMSFPPLAARGADLSSKDVISKEISSNNGEVEMVFYTLPEGETVTPGEAYKLRLTTVEGKTFTSTVNAPVLAPLTITTSDEQQIEPETPFIVQWQPIQHAEIYVVGLAFPDVTDTTFIVGTASQKTFPGELFTEEGDYYINVMAYAGKVAQYLDWSVKKEFPLIYDFDDPKVLGTFSSATGNGISVRVRTEGGEEPEEPEQPGTMEITVSAGLKPTISWTGGNAKLLSVMPADQPGTFMWSIMGAESGFASPVVYGQLPSGTIQVFGDAKLLVAGTTYGVSIIGVSPGALGTTTFTP